MFSTLLVITQLLGTTPSIISEAGTLQIYDFPTQISTIACRTLTDEHNRPTQEIYYRSTTHGTYTRSNSPSLKEQRRHDLHPYAINLHRYDDLGQRVWTGTFSPAWTLESSEEIKYDASGYPQTTRRRDATGIVRSESRRLENRGFTDLFFDETGKQLISLRGRIPSDQDLSSGWGSAVDGLSCAIGLPRAHGKLKDLSFELMVRNHTDSTLNVISGLQYQFIKLQLKDASGNLVPEDTDYLRQRDQRQRERNPHLKEGEGLHPVAAHEAQIFTGGYSLNEWYRQLPAGTYTLTVTRRAAGPDFSLVSNPVQLTVLAD